MDVSTAVICVGVVVFSACVVYLTSVFGMREKTYEEALEEQKRKSNLDGLIKQPPNKSEKKKAKKEKGKKKEEKKNREKSVTAEQPASKSSVQLEPNPKIKSEVDSDQSSKNVPHKEHVEFKEPEVIELTTEEQEVSIRLRKASLDKKLKPILVHKSESGEVPDVVAKDKSTEHQTKPQRGNSFEVKHPKDEYELIRHKEMKKLSISNLLASNADAEASKNKDGELSKTNSASPIESQPVQFLHQQKVIVDNQQSKLSSLERNGENGEPEKSVTPSTKRSKRNKSNSGAEKEGNSSDLSSKKIVDLIKTAALNNEEIQLLINELLNKQGDGSAEWTKKNDPVAIMRKQLQEKEQALEAESHNLMAAMARMRELRQELAQEKTKQSNFQNKVSHQHQEIQTLQARFQQTHEQHVGDVKALQLKMQQMQAKLTDERNVALQRMQEDNARLQQTIQQLESERSGLEALPILKHEVEQLRAERQNYELRQAAFQKGNDDLHRQINHYKEMLNTVAEEKFSFQQKLDELTSLLQKAEVTKSSLGEELQLKCKQCNNLKEENQNANEKIDNLREETRDQMRKLENEIQDLYIEKTSLLNKLAEQEKMFNEQIITSGNNKDALNVSEMQEMKTELNAFKDRSSKLEYELELKQKENAELGQKHNATLVEMQVAEKTTHEKVKEVENAFNSRLQEKLKIYEDEKHLIQTKLNSIEEEKRSLVEVQDKLKKCLERLKLSKDASDNLIVSVDVLIEEYLVLKENASNSNSISDKSEITNLKELISIEKEKVEKLTAENMGCKSALSDTERVLSDLQANVENEESQWHKKLNDSENRIENLRHENDKLLKEKLALEASIEQISSLRETISEMEIKLKELQGKLQGEESEKKLLEAKYEEVSKKNQVNSKMSAFQKSCEESHKNLESEYEKLKSDFEQTKQDYDKEKKICKDLQMQNTKLNSLVKIGQDSLKAEMDRVNQLETQLNLKNGSVSNSNGPPETLKVNNTSTVESSEESTYTDNQTPTKPRLKTHKSKKRAAWDKK